MTTIVVSAKTFQDDLVKHWDTLGDKCHVEGRDHVCFTQYHTIPCILEQGMLN